MRTVFIQILTVAPARLCKIIITKHISSSGDILCIRHTPISFPRLAVPFIDMHDIVILNIVYGTAHIGFGKILDIPRRSFSYRRYAIRHPLLPVTSNGPIGKIQQPRIYSRLILSNHPSLLRRILDIHHHLHTVAAAENLLTRLSLLNHLPLSRVRPRRLRAALLTPQPGTDRAHEPAIIAGTPTSLNPLHISNTS